MAAANLKAPAEFAKPVVSTQRPKLPLLTPDSLQSAKGPLKSSKPKHDSDRDEDNLQPGRPLHTSDRKRSRSQKPHSQKPVTAPRELPHSFGQQSGSTLPVSQDVRAQGDVLHQCMQYAPPVHPIYHPLPPPPTLQPDPSLVHLRHTTEVMSRQAAEIAQLRVEAERAGSRHEEELSRLRRELAELEERRKKERKGLEAEVHHQRECHVEENLQKDEHHSTNFKELTSKMEALRSQSDEREVDLGRKLEQTEQALKDANEEVEGLEIKYETDMREKNDALTRTSAQLSQMKVYIQDSRPSTKTVAEWDAERNTMEKRIKELGDTVETLKATEELVNIRLTSTQQLLSLQESEILQGQTVIRTPDETAASILTKWREKVYAMLVQQKSQEITAAEEHRKHNTKLNDLQNQLEKSQMVSQKLEHTLADRAAELNLEKQMNQAKLQELQSTEQIAEGLDQQLTSWEEAGVSVKRMLSDNQEFFQCRTADIQGALKKLSAAEQRISFATSRVALLKDLFARKESSWRIAISKASGAPSMCQSQDAEVQTDESNECPPWDGIQAELDQVRQERDRLAAELREQAQQTERRVAEALQSLEEQIIILREKNTELERNLHQESKSVTNLREELNHRDRENQDLMEANAILRVDQSRIEANAESASSEKCLALEEKYQSEMREMEKRLNEARREHAKAVVSYRQMERQLNREKARAAEALESRETYLSGEMERLKKKLREAEKDKNLLMTTLRQEGLISKYKSYRRSARAPDSDTEEEEVPPVTRGAPLVVEGDGRSTAQVMEGVPEGPSDQESLSAMLKDVQSLAERVLSDDLGDVT